MRILIIEDDPALCDALKSQLENAGYDVDLCSSGTDAPFYIMQKNADLILLDRMLPGIDGLTILKMMRQNQIHTPVILATAMDQIEDRIEGLDCGADDYIVKPYDVKELMARIRALTRRPMQMTSTTTLTYLDLSLDCEQYTINCGETELTLSKKEAALFEYFLKNPEKTLSRELLLSHVWGADCTVEDGNLDNYIHFARKRLKTLKSNAVLKTVHGVGYRLEHI
ncbi:response regulator transcription factor [Roseburia sp. 499]|uniref:response regulator transcription factor n=1 Tax=Roseburia sp. 499 TaxID=1261634 RepID=UPI000950F674|nr:response regulator transcription factor [Roseburia sp. 499]WVK69201.1 response regulator transcription factor [Roseburia sp. 499]